ncbi:MAG: hypothetical protein ACFBSE_17190 [Prochloraceae cyanobacterium]
MRTQYNKITLCAFRLKKQLPIETFSVLKFPEPAIPVIKNLMAEREGKNADKVNITIKSLQSALRL